VHTVAGHRHNRLRRCCVHGLHVRRGPARTRGDMNEGHSPKAGIHVRSRKVNCGRIACAAAAFTVGTRCMAPRTGGGDIAEVTE
jgi:hypothetical protein